MTALSRRLAEIKKFADSLDSYGGTNYVAEMRFLLSIIEEWERALLHIEGALKGVVMTHDGDHTGRYIKSPPDVIAKYALAKAEELAGK